MIGKRIAYLLGAVVLVGSGGYVFVYLYRWEWHRAIVAGLFLVVAEVALATTVLLRRLAALDRRLTEVVEASARPRNNRMTGPLPGIFGSKWAFHLMSVLRPCGSSVTSARYSRTGRPLRAM